MRKMTQVIGMAVFVGAFFLSGAVAQADDVPARGPAPFTAYDADGNGSISEQEFNALKDQRRTERADEGRPGFGLANAPTFSEMDANGDGRLSQEELAASQQNQSGKGGMGMGQGRR